MNTIGYGFISCSASRKSEKGITKGPTQNVQHQHDRSNIVYDTHKKRRQGQITRKKLRSGGKKSKVRSTKQFGGLSQLGGGHQGILQGL